MTATAVLHNSVFFKKLTKYKNIMLQSYLGFFSFQSLYQTTNKQFS